jgi:hypothetical protein
MQPCLQTRQHPSNRNGRVGFAVGSVMASTVARLTAVGDAIVLTSAVFVRDAMTSVVGWWMAAAERVVCVCAVATISSDISIHAGEAPLHAIHVCG